MFRSDKLLWYNWTFLGLYAAVKNPPPPAIIPFLRPAANTHLHICMIYDWTAPTNEFTRESKYAVFYLKCFHIKCTHSIPIR